MVYIPGKMNIQDHENIVAKQKSQITRLLKLLKNIQFVDGRCPVCQGWNVGPYGETDYVHTKKCPLAAELKDA